MKVFFGTAFAAVFATFLFNVALWGGLIWIAVHFIHKFW